MRTIPFREVLHGVAYKLGLDPDQSNFLTNQAIPIGTYIDEWTRRVYDARDWPEWTLTHIFAPNASTHVVRWDAQAIDVASSVVKLGRVLKVFLIDPRTTDAPISTEFTILDDGIHVGYQHGTYVWIRYLAPPPHWTAVTWLASETYQRDDVAYSYRVGEVYRSKTSGNLGHDPADPGEGGEPTFLQVEETQQGTVGDPGSDEINGLYTVRDELAVSVDDPPLDGIYSVISRKSNGDAIPDPPGTAVFTIEIRDSGNVLIGGGSYTPSINMSLAEIFLKLKIGMTVPTGFTTALSTEGTNQVIRITSASDFTVTATWGATALLVRHDQTYTPPAAGIFVDPPTNGSVFNIEVFDADDVSLGVATNTANGTDTLSVIFTDLTAQLQAEPGLAAFDSITLTTPGPPISIEIEDDSEFSVTATWSQGGVVLYPLYTAQVQAYTPARPPTPSALQELTLTISPTQVVADAVYQLTFTGTDSVEHTVSYTALAIDNETEILNELINAMVAAQAADPFFSGIHAVVDPTGSSVVFTIDQILGQVSLNATVIPQGSAFWALVPFPRVIADTVMTGAYGDLLKEWGQTDKGMIETQAADLEVATAELDYKTTPAPPLTGQQLAAIEV